MIAAELLKLANEQDACLVFVPRSNKNDDDKDEHKKVAEMIKSNPKCRVEIICPDSDYMALDIAAIFRDAELVTIMRLLGCVIAHGEKHPPFSGI